MGSQPVRASVLGCSGKLITVTPLRQSRDCYLEEEVPSSRYLWKAKTQRQSSSMGIILL